MRDPKWGERPMALAVVEPQFSTGPEAEEAIRAHVKSYVDCGIISKYAIPEPIMIVKDLPLTSVGKIDKKALREKYQPQKAG